MAVYATGKGNWGVDYRDEWGVRHRKPVGTEAAARAIHAELIEQTHTARAALSNFAAGEAFALADARDAYLAHLPVSDRTRWNVHQRIDRLIAFTANAAIAQVTPRLLEAFAAQRAREVAPTTQAYELQVVKRLFAWLVREHYIPSSPADALLVTKGQGNPPHVLTYQEEAAVLADLSPLTRLRVILALDAGLTVSEIHALRRQAVNFTERTVTSWRSKTRRERTIPLTHRLVGILKAHAAHLAPDSLLLAWAGRQIKKGTDFLKPMRRRIGIHFRFHDLRHTFATRLAAACPNPFVVAALLGHTASRRVWNPAHNAMPNVTFQYVHPAPDELRAAIEAMERSNPNAAGKT
jgi:integrase